MNTEKAIDLLDNLIGMVDDNQENDYDSAFHMAIDALKAQTDGDTISRKAAIDAIEGVDWYHIDSDGQLTHGANSKEDEPLYKAKDVYKVLNDMPSAQPKKRTEERTETHACDLISRQAAIDALENTKEVAR